MNASPPARSAHPTIGFGEFVALLASLMALTALAIDAMLPALPEIGDALGVPHPNGRQWIVTAFLLGFGVAHILYGSLSDRFGRRPVLLGATCCYVLFGLLAAVADSFPLMLAARALQGAAAAGTRVVSISIIRDCYVGRTMARVMSLTTIVFLAVPVVAPGIGTLILMVAPWRWIFAMLAVWGLVVLLWGYWRLPETLAPEARRPLSFASVGEAAKTVVCNRTSLGYALAQTVMLGSLYGFINSSQQIFFDTFHAPRLFPAVFAGVAGAMALASLVNSRIVEGLGMRRVSHAALIGFTGFAAVHTLIAASGYETIVTFAVVQAATMACFGLAMGNFGAMAMEPLGKIAGMASSIQGFLTVVGGSLIGFAIGQSFDGTTLPLAAGYFLAGAAALGIILITERGTLFVAHRHRQPIPAPPIEE